MVLLRQTYLFAFRIFPAAAFLAHSWCKEYPHSGRVPISSLVLLKCLGKGVEYLINSHSLGSPWQMQRTDPASRWDLRGLQQVPAHLDADSDPSLLLEGKMREHEALWAVLRLNFLPKTNSNEINYSVFSGGCRGGRIRLYFQPKRDSWWMTGIQHLLSVWQHSLLLLLSLMKRCREICCRTLKCSITSTGKYTCLCGLGVDGFDCI